MLLSRLAPLILLPFVAADGVHRLKLKKLAPATSNPQLESAYLAEKYGGFAQTPLVGSSIGRNVRVSRPTVKDGEELYWTQDEFTAEGGHNVPLSSKWTRDQCFSSILIHATSDFMNAQYFAEITLGTPPQNVSDITSHTSMTYR